ncbi:MAG: hypothetical protein J5528_00340 [Firmicutes bacterium]|nr:hypothetical protein [Bacillota bacterium]
MKKTTALILIAVLTLVFAGGLYGLVKEVNNDASYSYTFHRNLEIKGGMPDPEQTSVDFGIDEDGKYNISLSWLPMGKKLSDLKDLQPSDYSFITGCVISSAEDPCVYATTAGWITVDTTIEMKAGTYTVTFYYLTSREAYAEFAKEFFGDASAEYMADWFEWDSFKKDDKLVISYNNSVRKAGSAGIAGVWLLIVMITLAGIVLVAVFWFVTKGTFDKAKYDERQLIEKGKGSTYALYTIIAYMLALFLLDAAELLNRNMMTPMYMGAVMLGVTVGAVYSIWKECYFALNQNKPRYILLMSLVGLFNAGFGIFDIVIAKKMASAGSPIYYRLLRFGICGFELAAAFMVIAIAIFLKHRADQREEEE